jgi:hypothetical protein
LEAVLRLWRGSKQHAARDFKKCLIREPLSQRLGRQAMDRAAANGDSRNTFAAARRT